MRIGNVYEAPPPPAVRPSTDGYYWLRVARHDWIEDPNADNDTEIWTIEWMLAHVDVEQKLYPIHVIGSDEIFQWDNTQDFVVVEVGPKVDPPKEEIAFTLLTLDLLWSPEVTTTVKLGTLFFYGIGAWSFIRTLTRVDRVRLNNWQVSDDF